MFSSKQTVLPSLQAAVQGKKQSEAANILINFVQTAFDYKTDGDQFGYEKPFFVDELFYYPFPIAKTVLCYTLIWYVLLLGLMLYCWNIPITWQQRSVLMKT